MSCKVFTEFMLLPRVRSETWIRGRKGGTAKGFVQCFLETWGYSLDQGDKEVMLEH